jgi:hypothetical protein
MSPLMGWVRGMGRVTISGTPYEEPAPYPSLTPLKLPMHFPIEALLE